MDAAHHSRADRWIQALSPVRDTCTIALALRAPHGGKRRGGSAPTTLQTSAPPGPSDEDSKPPQPLGPLLLLRVFSTEDRGGTEEPPAHAGRLGTARAGLRQRHLWRGRQHALADGESGEGHPIPR